MEVLFEFLPYCFCLNRHNYARNLSYYYVHMRPLKEENAAAYKYLEEGGFSGSLTGRPRSRIPFDQVIEMNINKSCKDVGGLSGNTENPGAIKRWARIHHHILLYMNIKTRKKRRKPYKNMSSLVLAEWIAMKQMQEIPGHVLIHGFPICGNMGMLLRTLPQVKLQQMK